MTYKPLLAMLLSIPLTVAPLFSVRADTLDDLTTSSTNALIPLPTEPPLTNTVSSTEPTTSLSPALVTEVTSTSTTANPPASTSTVFCLAIIEPAPLQGPEWVAFYGLTPSTTNAVIGWTLADAQGTVLKLNSSSTLIWDEITQTIRLELKSSRLNNDGDTVIIKNSAGMVHDSFVYPGVQKGERWMRESCSSPWHIFPEHLPPAANTVITAPEVPPPVPAVDTAPSLVEAVPTPAVPEEAPTILPSPELSPVQSVEPVTDIEPTVPATTEAELLLLEQPPAGIIDDVSAAAAELLDIPPVAAPVIPSPIAPLTPSPAFIVKREPIQPIIAPPPAILIAPPIKTVTPPKKTLSPPPKKITLTPSPLPRKKTTTVKKPIILKSSSSLVSLSMSPLITDPETYQGVRVRVRGRVTSDKQILGAHRFVITNTDGRGLLIHATNKQISPTVGDLVDVTGKVVWNDEGLWIQQSTTDRWLPVITDNQQGSDLTAHRPNLQAPSQEDAWSFVRSTGVITDLQKSSFDMEVDGISVHVRVSSRLGYRVARLQKNDRVTVSGLLDLRDETSTIVPQGVDAIQIVERAKVVTSVSQPPVSRPWLPVGAAASTLGLSEGWRRLRDRQKRRREELAFHALKATHQAHR